MVCTALTGTARVLTSRRRLLLSQVAAEEENVADAYVSSLLTQASADLERAIVESGVPQSLTQGMRDFQGVQLINTLCTCNQACSDPHNATRSAKWTARKLAQGVVIYGDLTKASTGRYVSRMACNITPCRRLVLIIVSFRSVLSPKLNVIRLTCMHYFLSCLTVRGERH